MNYHSYPKAKDTPSRLSRKQARRSVYWHNAKLKKNSKKEASQRRILQSEQGA